MFFLHEGLLSNALLYIHHVLQQHVLYCMLLDKLGLIVLLKGVLSQAVSAGRNVSPLLRCAVYCTRSSGHL